MLLMVVLKNGIKVGVVSGFRGDNYEPYRQQVVFPGVHSLVWNAKAKTRESHHCGSTYWACIGSRCGTIRRIQHQLRLNRKYFRNAFCVDFHNSFTFMFFFSISVTDPFIKSQSHCTALVISIPCISLNAI